MQARVFGQLGMKTAYIRGTQPDVNFATGYTRFGDGTFHPCPELDFASSDAAGMGAMPASDVVLLANSNFNQFATDRLPVAYQVHNAIAGLPRVKVFRITAPPFDLISCPNE